MAKTTNLAENFNKKLGIAKHHKGYILVKLPNHLRSDRRGYVRHHILTYEIHYRCSVLKWADVHHIDGDILNNDPSNLEAMMHGQHTQKTHTIENIKLRACSWCGSSKTRIQKHNGRPNWFRLEEDKSKFLCDKCYKKMKRRMNKKNV